MVHVTISHLIQSCWRLTTTTRPSVPHSPESIESDHVLRALCSTLRQALMLQPTRPSWLLVQADLFNGNRVDLTSCPFIGTTGFSATGKHGAALGHYLESGVVPSRYFEDDVPAEIWSQQVWSLPELMCVLVNIGHSTHTHTHTVPPHTTHTCPPHTHPPHHMSLHTHTHAHTPPHTGLQKDHQLLLTP